ncbi:permease [Sulfurovum sp. zt1-1]|uniref:Permease n=1 Tax=Sulfurovum zhangzhouensis TaxID=3019067 RepID=A0ABT7QYE7_9BACT|nr:permease [Sulfurovum zhangzhouensis]MDM5271875.1 permease [Sulfurovum zhangzhouensis]
MTIKGKQKSIGHIMLLIVISLYLLAAFLNPTSAYSALISSLSVLKTVLPILLVVLFLMTFINSYIQPKKISQYLGQKSGLKGWLIAIISGVFSHGPGYVWYPMLSDLRAHGVKDSLIIAFFYARSIKVPWLPMMAGYFGITFTVILSFYILAAAVIQGMIAEKLMLTK